MEIAARELRLNEDSREVGVPRVKEEDDRGSENKPDTSRSSAKQYLRSSGQNELPSAGQEPDSARRKRIKSRKGKAH